MVLQELELALSDFLQVQELIENNPNINYDIGLMQALKVA
jgi:hypothetical protein